jgi:hypothetical protein
LNFFGCLFCVFLDRNEVRIGINEIKTGRKEAQSGRNEIKTGRKEAKVSKFKAGILVRYILTVAKNLKSKCPNVGKMCFAIIG